MNLTEINERIIATKTRVELAERLSQKIQSAKDRLGELEVKFLRARRRTRSEREDVRNLDDLSFQNLIVFITGRRDQFKQIEWQEYAQARVEMEDAKEELEVLKSSLKRMKNEYADYLSATEDWQAARRAKQDYLLAVQDPLAEEIFKLGEEIAKLRIEKKELNQAYQAGEKADISLRKMARKLVNAMDMGRVFSLKIKVEGEDSWDSLTTAYRHSRQAKEDLRAFSEYLPGDGKELRKALTFTIKDDPYNLQLLGNHYDRIDFTEVGALHRRVAEVGKALTLARDECGSDAIKVASALEKKEKRYNQLMALK
jgi:hypothetical protein